MNATPIVPVNDAPDSNRTAKNLALMLALLTLVAGCATKAVPSASPLDFLGPLVNAPIIAPILALWADQSESRVSTQELHRNPRVLEGLDAQSQMLALRNLAYTLEQGRLHVSVYWENPANSSGRAAGAATVIRETNDDDGRLCREALIATDLENEPSDERVTSFCVSETGWRSVESDGSPTQ